MRKNKTDGQTDTHENIIQQNRMSNYLLNRLRFCRLGLLDLSVTGAVCGRYW